MKVVSCSKPSPTRALGLKVCLSVRKFAQDVVGPRVSAMDEAEEMDKVNDLSPFSGSVDLSPAITFTGHYSRSL